MSEAFTTAGIIIVSFLLFTYYVQKGFGGMSTPLRQFGMFLLTKAAGPAADLFQEREGSGEKSHEEGKDRRLCGIPKSQ